MIRRTRLTIAGSPHDKPSSAPLALAFAVTLVTACSSNNDDAPAIPQLTAATPATLQGGCEALAQSQFANTVIDSSTTVAAGELTVGDHGIASHCLVTGRMNERVSDVDGNTYAIGFEMRLPLDWNGRYFYQGNGGIDGSVVTAVGASGGGPLSNALDKGFAVISSDAGHVGSMGPFFGIDPQARLDYGYQAAQSLTPMAKSLISDAYGKGPDRSYFGGCSNGGRHTFNAFARMPGEYDGYLAGAPGYNLPEAAVANIFGAKQYATVATDPDDISTAFTADERATVAATVVAQCDALDGLEDGIIADVEACQATVSLADVPECTGDRDGSCLTAAQKTAIAPIFSGATTSDGTPVYAPFPFDAGLGAGGVAFWEFTAPVVLDPGAVGVIFGTPPADAATFDGPAFAFGTSIDDMVTAINASNDVYTESGMQFATPPQPTSLSDVRDRGAKIMVYHGVSDAIFSPLDSVDWINGVRANHGDADAFARLYLVPGMGHCSGGPSTDQFDMLDALVDWVENGVAPDSVVASVRGAGNAAEVNADLPADWPADRSRVLCPYPQVARYAGGDANPESADSFSCQ